MDKDKQILNLTQENKCLKSFILHHIPELVAINYFDNFEVKTILLDSYADLEEYAYKQENNKLKEKVERLKEGNKILIKTLEIYYKIGKWREEENDEENSSI